MGKIFGISDLPVTTIADVARQVTVPKPVVREVPGIKNFNKEKPAVDTILLSGKKTAKPGLRTRIRNQIKNIKENFNINK